MNVHISFIATAIIGLSVDRMRSGTGMELLDDDDSDADKHDHPYAGISIGLGDKC